jgi:hypothetical protein
MPYLPRNSISSLALTFNRPSHLQLPIASKAFINHSFAAPRLFHHLPLLCIAATVKTRNSLTFQSKLPKPDRFTTPTFPRIHRRTVTMSEKLIPKNPSAVQVIRHVTPNVVTVSVPFLRFEKIPIGGRATISKQPPLLLSYRSFSFVQCYFLSLFRPLTRS